MKILTKLFLLWIIATITFIACRQLNEPDVNDLLSKTVDISTPGSLWTRLTANELKDLNSLTITGIIDARDFKTIRENMSNLDKLDISRVKIAAYIGTEGTSGEFIQDYPANEIPTDAVSPNIGNLSILLPKSLTSIGINAFHNCCDLKKLIIPGSVTSIGSGAFSNCSGLESITIPDSVKTIEFGAFYNCRRLTNIKIPNSVISIEGQAFNSCHGLASVSIGNSVTSIGKDVFKDCEELTEIIVEQGNADYSSLNGVLFNKNLTRLILYPNGRKGVNPRL